MFFTAWNPTISFAFTPHARLHRTILAHADLHRRHVIPYTVQMSTRRFHACIHFAVVHIDAPVGVADVSDDSIGDTPQLASDSCASQNQRI